MSRPQKDPLRPLRDEERTELTGLSRSRSAPAAQVIRARTLLAVAAGRSYTEAAILAGRHTGDTIRDWVSRFNREGMVAVIPRHGGSLFPTPIKETLKKWGQRGEPWPATPDSGRAGRRVVFSIEIPTKASDGNHCLTNSHRS